LAKPSAVTPARPRLLALELWGLGDLALALPFLRAAADRADVTLLAPPHAAPLLRRFAPGVAHLPLTAPWTAFRGKYRLHRWPWGALRTALRAARAARFDLGVSARRDPRDHALLRLAGCRRRLGFPHRLVPSGLTSPLAPPASPHRAAHWAALAAALGWTLPAPSPAPRPGRRVVLHPGAGQPVRAWPLERFHELAARLTAAGWHVTLLEPEPRAPLDHLLDTLAGADRFVGNDSGPGHLAALLGVPTFTIFGPQLPALFSPVHPQAAWIDGAPCPHKPCFDACRFAVPHCLHRLDVDAVWSRLAPWLDHPTAPAPTA
jgi:heptosyltransferase-2